MAIQLSPGVNVSEIDLTTVVPAVSTSIGAFAGGFAWGPAAKIITVPDEITLVNTFGQPDTNTFISFFTCASFLSYGNNLQVIRAVASTSNNAIANANASGVQVVNEDIFENYYLNNNNANTFGPFMARYPGALGNSIAVSIIDAGPLQANGAIYSNNFSGWAYASYFTGAANTSSSAVTLGASYDEMHIVVIDKDGVFPQSQGVRGAVLETWPFLSKAYDGNDPLGNPSYYKQALWNNSNYIYAIDPPNYSSTQSTWGKFTAGTTFATLPSSQYIVMSQGNDASIEGSGTGAPYSSSSTSALEQAYDRFANKDHVDIDLVLTAAANATVQKYVVENVAAKRADCVAFVSPPSSAVIANYGNETTAIQSWVQGLNIASQNGSYAVADSAWKYMFDKYNNVYRYVPLNGDIAGLCAFTDKVRDAWWSPAGFNRGGIKNAIKLSWNANQTYRDQLYSIGVNPVVSFPGNGIVLYGDKTLQSKPSAFDRINVRRLFIVLEKAISLAAKYSLFEFNDDFTRSQFVSLITPYLRDIQGRRGITDFRVVCDTTNNTGQVIDSNHFVGDIYIKPARAINFIQLNFVAVRTGVDFTEVVGKF